MSAIAGLSLVAGCSNVKATGIRSGKLYPSLAEGCPVRFENLSYQEASATLEMVGLVTLSGATDQPQAWEGETRERLSPKVCELGGTVVTPNGMVSGESYLGLGTGAIQFAVWRER
ncbi:hypothetical protein LZ198_28265 [Myxococcus sp. K15C18031901]|uniref:hypothetical protein n=1 Tax=Myxococcus dinghuensis TaxID=2906761 RepID=UPI0020A76FDA|nr:hypothetical protein [Myxococcus dinghuensis]MCP3102778.1 hypothetical protein [Myxococcus dinghuensis]